MDIKPETVHEIISARMQINGYDLVLDLEKSQGPYIHDSRSGSSYLDFFSCFASLPLGYNHPSMREPGFLRELGKAAVNKPSNTDLYTIQMAEFVDTFQRVALPGYMKYLFFISGGALAVENALKAAMDWKVRLNKAAGSGREKGHRIIHFTSAFHGRSGYTLSLTNTTDKRKTEYYPKFNWPRISAPFIDFPLKEDNLKKVKEREESALREIREEIQSGGEDIAGLIIEPIQGEGGDNHFREEFFQSLEDICRKNDILLIVDEVQTGMGLTGRMWAHQHFGIEPDLIVFGKKTQVCGIMAGNRLDRVEKNVFREPSRISSTFGGNLVDMVRCSMILKIIEKENLVENASEMGVYLLQKLLGLEQGYGEIITNCRGRGLMCAFDLPDSGKRERLIKRCYENLLILLPCGSRSVRFRPPLNINREDIDCCFERLHKSLEEELL